MLRYTPANANYDSDNGSDMDVSEDDGEIPLDMTRSQTVKVKEKLL